MKEIIIDGVEYVLTPKTKSDLDIMKEKYESGEYIHIHKAFFNDNKNGNWIKAIKEKGNLSYQPDEDYKKSTFKQRGYFITHYVHKLIHKKHKHILDAYLEDNLSVKWKVSGSADVWHCRESLIEEYNEDYIYEIKPKEEYPQFRLNSDYEILKFTSEKDYEVVFSYSNSYIGCKFRSGDINSLSLKPIPYNKERNLYHKQPVWFRLHIYDELLDIYGIGYYNAVANDVIYSITGGTCPYNEVEPITPEQLKVMPFIFNMYQELKD